jgi:hypothetical protein
VLDAQQRAVEREVNVDLLTSNVVKPPAVHGQDDAVALYAVGISVVLSVSRGKSDNQLVATKHRRTVLRKPWNVESKVAAWKNLKDNVFHIKLAEVGDHLKLLNPLCCLVIPGVVVHVRRLRAQSDLQLTSHKTFFMNAQSIVPCTQWKLAAEVIQRALAELRKRDNIARSPWVVGCEIEWDPQWVLNHALTKRFERLLDLATPKLPFELAWDLVITSVALPRRCPVARFLSL